MNRKMGELRVKKYLLELCILLSTGYVFILEILTEYSNRYYHIFPLLCFEFVMSCIIGILLYLFLTTEFPKVFIYVLLLLNILISVFVWIQFYQIARYNLIYIVVALLCLVKRYGMKKESN